MTKEQAIKDATRVKQYYPYRITIVYQLEGEWDYKTGKTMAMAHNLLKKGAEVYKL